MAGIGFVLQKAHQAGTALSGRMEQTAAHGGMHGAYPYSTVSGGQRPGRRRRIGGAAAVRRRSRRTTLRLPDSSVRGLEPPPRHPPLPGADATEGEAEMSAETSGAPAHVRRLAAGEGRVPLRPAAPSGRSCSPPRSSPRSRRSPWRTCPRRVVFWPAALVLAAAALIRVGGRTGDEWIAGLASYLTIRARGQHRFAGGPFAPPAAAAAAAAEPREAPHLDLPGILAPLRILSVPAGRPRPGGRRQPSRPHVHGCRPGPLPRHRPGRLGQAGPRVAGWGALLASLCTEGTPLIRVQALQRLVPESGAALRSWHAGHLAPGAPALAADVTAELLATATLTTSRREAFLAFTMDARRARAQIRAAGGGDRGAAAVLVRHLRGLHQAIGGADLEVEDWLGTRDLAEVIRTAFDPRLPAAPGARRAAAASAGGRGAAGAAAPPGVSPDLAGPGLRRGPARPLPPRRRGERVVLGARLAPARCTPPRWRRCSGDGSHRRSFAIIFEPLSPRAAERAVMRERTARHVAVRMRQRTGQIVPEHERAAMERALRQDAERAAGHGLVRFTGYASPPSPTRPTSRTRARRWKPTPPPRGSRSAACGSPRTSGSRSARCRWAWACPKRWW